MAFDNITTAELAVDKPITNELMEKFKNRDDFLNAQVGTLGSITISNPSFEVDSDGDGHPDNWDETFFTGGTGAIDTALSVHGAQSYKFTHPGGAGNGGGQIESDFFPVSTIEGYQIEYSILLNGGAVPKAAIINYNRNQSTISEVVLDGSSDTATTGVWAYRAHGYLPSSAATANSSVTFIKIRLTGGSSDHTTAGTVNFDNVKMEGIRNASAGNFEIANSASRVVALGPGATAISHAFPVKVVKPGAYKIQYNTSAGNAPGALRILLNGSILSTVNPSSGLSTHSHVMTDKRAKYGDEFLFEGILTTSINIKNYRFSVKDPFTGGVVFSQLDTSTAAT